MDLTDILKECDSEEFVGHITKEVLNEKINSVEMVASLIEAGSDSENFKLTDDGQELDDDDE